MYNKFIKRLFDIVLALAAILLLSPLLLFIVLTIKISSPGPVFFKQKRVGIHKTRFNMIKFRTMRVDTPTHLLEDPDRYITFLGKFFREFSLDELPQIFCILAGKMSFIGPRPALWNQFDLIAERDKYGANDGCLTPGRSIIPQTVEERAKTILILTNIDEILFHLRTELIQALLKNSWRVLISSPKGRYYDFLENLGCQMLETPVDRRGVNPIKDFALLRRYRRLMKQERPDVVLTYTIKPNVYGGWTAGRLGVPCIATVTGLGTAVQNPGLLQKLTLFLYRQGFRRNAKVFFQNEDNRDILSRRRIVRPEQIVMTSGSGVNLERYPFEPYPTDDGTVRFVYIARLMKDKGINEFAEMVERIGTKYPQTRFDILGVLEESCEDLVQRMTADGRAVYHGYQTNIRPFLQRAHAIILPSYHEGMANVLLEAAATGRPILASNIPGCRETFDEGVSGFGFEPKNADDLVRAVEKFVQLPYEQKATSGAAGREKMEREFDRNIVIDEYLKNLNAVILERLSSCR